MFSGQTSGSALLPRLQDTKTSQITGIWYKPASLFLQYLLANRRTRSSTMGDSVVGPFVIIVLGVVGCVVVVVVVVGVVVGVVVVVVVVGVVVVVVVIVVAIFVVGRGVVVVVVVVVGLLVVVVVGLFVVGLGVGSNVVVGLTGAEVVVRRSRLASANPFK